MKELSKEKIEELFEFVKSKNVPHKDTRCEIVDHLASAIEDMQEHDSNLSFNSALKKVYNKFPITGFAQLQLEKENALRKYWRKKILGYLGNFLTPPKIILSIALFMLISFLVSHFEGVPMLKHLSGVFIIALILKEVLLKFRILPYQVDKSCYLVIESLKKEITWITCLLVFIPIYFWSIGPSQDALTRFSGIGNYLLSFGWTSAIILTYASIKVFPEMLKEEIEKKYAHLNIKVA